MSRNKKEVIKGRIDPELMLCVSAPIHLAERVFALPIAVANIQKISRHCAPANAQLFFRRFLCF
jgi:hypothetical protein